MAHSFLICDFGGNEELAQQARLKIDAWKQGYRLDKKLQVKFDRKEQEAKPEEELAPVAKPEKSTAKGKVKPGAKTKSKSSQDDTAPKAAQRTSNHSEIRLIVRLDFSDHEKLSHQRWIERIPTEEPFKAAKPKIVRPGQPEYKATSDLFDSLD